jgi:glycosyltransferase involved in cell wall biosynthesis
MTSGTASAAAPSSGPPVRVAFLSDAVLPFHHGGKEKRLAEVTRELAAAGYIVDVYTMGWWPGGRTHRDGQVRMHAIAPALALYSGSRRSVRQALLFALATPRLIFRRFDVLDVDHVPFLPLFAARVVCWLRRKPMVATWHEVWGRDYWRAYLGRPGRLAAIVERWSARTPDHIVAVSDHTARRLVGLLGVRCPVTTVPLGVDLDLIDSVPAAGAAPDVLFVGRLLPNKRVDLLLAALAAAGRDGRRLTCHIVGDGPDRARLEDLARGFGVADRAVFTGPLPYRHLYGLMKSAGVLVLPSDREGFGLVVLEANACDLPAITVGHPDNAAKDLIADGRNGLVCAADPEPLAAAVADVLDRRATLRPRAHLDARVPAPDWASVAAAVGAVLAGAAARRPTAAAGGIGGRP